jgi:hypothetical protein
MPRTFLKLIQDFADEVGIPQPSQIIGGADDTSRQLLSLANREGKEFASMANSKGGWQELHKEYRFLTVCLENLTGNTTQGSGIITGISDTTGIVAGTWLLTANNFASICNVVSVDSSTQITVDLLAEATETGVSLTIGQAAYDLPSDFDYFALRTFWDNAYRWELLGALDAQQKQILRYGLTQPVINRKFYIKNNRMWLIPTPATNGDLIAYDYYSNAWCQSASGVAQSSWQADTDTYLLGEEAFIFGMKWRYLRAKGLDYGQEKADYDAECRKLISRDGTSPVLPLAGGLFANRFLDNSNIPDTNFGEPYNG